MTGSMKRILVYTGAGVFLIAAIWLAISYFLQQATLANLNEEKIQLQKENQTLTDSYNEALGRAKANELMAKEEKAKADAIIARIEAGDKNVKAFDDKLEKAVQKYEEAKRNQGECVDTDECYKLLCAELRAAGFPCK